MTKILLIAGAIAVFATAAACISGCSGQSKKYIVDYCGAKNCYKNAKARYKAGEHVILVFDMVATDTDYSFYLNGESPEVTYSDKGHGGFKISFVMPAFDVKLECSSRNTMMYVPSNPSPEEEMKETVLFDYQQSNAQGGYKRVVYLNGSGKTYPRLEVYQRGTADTEVFKASYKADYSNFLACHEIISKYGLYSWDIRRDTAVDEGTPIVFSYSAHNGKVVSVSTKRMPVGGREALEKILALLESCICEENRM